MMSGSTTMYHVIQIEIFHRLPFGTAWTTTRTETPPSWRSGCTPNCPPTTRSTCSPPATSGPTAWPRPTTCCPSTAPRRPRAASSWPSAASGSRRTQRQRPSSRPRTWTRRIRRTTTPSRRRRRSPFRFCRGCTHRASDPPSPTSATAAPSGQSCKRSWNAYSELKIEVDHGDLTLDFVDYNLRVPPVCLFAMPSISAEFLPSKAELGRQRNKQNQATKPLAALVSYAGPAVVGRKRKWDDHEFKIWVRLIRFSKVRIVQGRYLSWPNPRKHILTLSRCVAKRQSSKPRESSHNQRSVRVGWKNKEKILKNKFQGQWKNLFFCRGHSPTIPQQLPKVSRRLGQA